MWVTSTPHKFVTFSPPPTHPPTHQEFLLTILCWGVWMFSKITICLKCTLHIKIIWLVNRVNQCYLRINCLIELQLATFSCTQSGHCAEVQLQFFDLGFISTFQGGGEGEFTRLQFHTSYQSVTCCFWIQNVQPLACKMRENNLLN